MKCTCTENEICDSHRLIWDMQRLANELETELDSQKLYNQLPTITPTQGDTNEKRPNLS